MAKATFIGAASAAVTFGIGSAATNLFTNFYSQAAFQAVAHGTFQGTMTAISGGKFWSGFAAGALSSIAASAWQGGSTQTEGFSQENNWAYGAKTITHTGLGSGTGNLGMIAFGTVMGGAGAALTGGNFWQGAVTGLVVSGLNHAMHQTDSDEPGDPPTKRKLSLNDIKKESKFFKEIGASAEFIDAMDKSLKGNSKILGKFGKVGGYLSAGGQIIYDGVEYHQGKISGYRFSFRLGSTLTSAVVGAEVGAAMGGPAGFAVGTIIGISAGAAESAWDVWFPQFQQSVNHFYNTTINNIMRYH